MEAIVLAGGMGTRLRAAVDGLPKPMAPVLSKPFLEHLLAYWAEQGIDHFVLSIGHLHERITEHFGDSFGGASISYSIESEPLGTGGASLLAVSRLRSNETALLLNGDTFLETRLAGMLEFHRRMQSQFTLGLVRRPENSRYGRIRADRDGRCGEIGGTPEAGGVTEINGGLYVIEPDFVASWKASSGRRLVSLEDEMLPDWISGGERIFGYRAAGSFIDIGTPADYGGADAFFSARREAGCESVS